MRDPRSFPIAGPHPRATGLRPAVGCAVYGSSSSGKDLGAGSRFRARFPFRASTRRRRNRGLARAAAAGLRRRRLLLLPDFIGPKLPQRTPHSKRGMDPGPTPLRCHRRRVQGHWQPALIPGFHRFRRWRGSAARGYLAGSQRRGPRADPLRPKRVTTTRFGGAGQERRGGFRSIAPWVTARTDERDRWS
jgi:hypothetical protein